jgi:hypothetical protein
MSVRTTEQVSSLGYKGGVRGARRGRGCACYIHPPSSYIASCIYAEFRGRGGRGVAHVFDDIVAVITHQSF